MKELKENSRKNFHFEAKMKQKVSWGSEKIDPLF
jgi:hypothetical protein